MEKENEITLESVVKEGLSDKFILLLEQELSRDFSSYFQHMDDYVECDMESFFKEAQELAKVKESSKRASMMLLNALKIEEKALRKKYYLCLISSFLRIFEHLFSSLDLQEASKDYCDYLKGLLCHMKVLKNYVEDSYAFFSDESARSLEPGLNYGYTCFFQGVIVSLDWAFKVLEQKTKICSALTRPYNGFVIHYPHIDFSFCRDEKILREGYQMLQQHEEEMVDDIFQECFVKTNLQLEEMDKNNEKIMLKVLSN